MSISEDNKTHSVENQPPPLGPYNAWLTDRALKEAVSREGAAWAAGHLEEFGEFAGDELIRLGFAANENPPKLLSFDPYGNRIDEVEFHPFWHRIMSVDVSMGVHSFAWRNSQKDGAHVARAALFYLAGQGEAGTLCPLSMTYAAIPAVRKNARLASEWVPRLTSLVYDPRAIPMQEKQGGLIGMGMTEKQGGSDVRTNKTRAVRLSDGSYELVGHKWFFSAPMCDAHLVLARADGALSCFLVPRILPDGSKNAVEIQRLKDKLGDRSNASAEVEFRGAVGWLVGEEGRGIATIIEMVALTRLDCLTGSSALMRQAVVRAVHHCRHRKAFGKYLVQQPLMRNVLADLALESEAAVALSLRVARAVDASDRDPIEAAFARIATAIGKYWVCKRTSPHVNECQECLGGIGYIEESILPRLYRQAPLNSIWEGSGNVQCLDVLRALGRSPETREAFFNELGSAKGMDKDFDAATDRLSGMLDFTDSAELRSRRIVEQAALALQASVLLRSGNEMIARAFCRSRLAGEHGYAFGTLDPEAPFAELIERAAVAN